MTKRAGWDTWFAIVQELGQAHGSELVDAMCEAAKGKYFVGPSDADDALNAAEREGLIKRGALSPTHSQRAFAGLSFSKKGYAEHARFYASHWYWLRVAVTDRMNG